ncbi:NnrS family protein [Lutibaculum baratangense]|uniref:NnrS protein involved in response to NO n=1 Tax=Lutibaculum baratangense AMV1 TaxID=631454 RepID=V4RJL7_9HYPH|nr:NnrS family protein [Lutibaculum baratangense]ESR23430.1 NnrS protein involved in response to NO [Lutibaculum baratangense AMV1]
MASIQALHPRPGAEAAADRYSWPHWLSGGFRPFFFGGALAMALSVLAWLPTMMGLWQIPTAFTPRDWHVHTLIFGGVLAIVAGFALTAVSNWTGRKPVAGRLLALLVVLWLAGRVATSFSGLIGAYLAAAVDLLFPAALVFVFAREVVAGGNRRNLVVVGLVALLGLTDAAFHYEAITRGTADHALRAGVAVVLMLVLLIGGRIIPAFTRNWLASRTPDRLPKTFDRVDAASIMVAAVALALWVLEPFAEGTGLALLAAGALAFARLLRWRGLATQSEPLLAVLHVAFLTVPLGFVLVGTSALSPVVDAQSAVHVWTAGTFGLITLAVMTRASRGHSGHPLTAGRLELSVFALVIVGAAARVASPYAGGIALDLLNVAGLAWAGAYLAFAAGYARMLLVRPARP